MGKIVKCQCGRVSDLAHASSCPYCGRLLDGSATAADANLPTPVQSAPLSAEKIDELIVAQYRAAAASRALPVLLVTILLWGIPSSLCSGIGLAWYISAQDSYYYRSQGMAGGTFFIVLGGIFALVGILVGTSRASKELDRSRVPGSRG